MKKNLFLIISVLHLSSSLLWAESNGPSGRLGIGVREPGKLTQWEYFVKLFVSKRVDLSAGFSYRADTEGGYDRKILPLGLGTFYHLFPNNPVHLKLGARIGYEYENWNSSFQEITSNFWAFEPSMGVEYFFSSHFSLGPEVSLQLGRLFEKFHRKDTGMIAKYDSSVQ